MSNSLRLDEVGEWSEFKLEIVKEYASAYSSILNAQKDLSHIYVDAFAGAGVHISKETGLYIPGSPLNALHVEPRFDEYHFVDIDSHKVALLNELIGNRADVHIHQGDCNKVLLEEILPGVEYKLFKRALCVLDPYGMHLNWEVIEVAGKMGTIDLFINFPIADINRNALRRDQSKVSENSATRFSNFWGDESWRDIAFRPRRQNNFFEEEYEKITNKELVEAFCVRLREIAGYKHVAEPIDMRNSNNATVYYLLFASQKAVAAKIIKAIVNRPRRK
jgi:three-Cys-motif partner protein